MAQPIEIAYSRVWNRKSLLCLRASELGAYMALTHACLVQGFDPLPADSATLMVLGRMSPKSWAIAEKRIGEALRDTLGVLKEAYRRAEVMRDRRVERARLGGEGNKLSCARKAELTVRAHNFVAESNALAVTLIQPQFKATNFSSNKTDLKARSHAKAAMRKSCAAVSALTD